MFTVGNRRVLSVLRRPGCGVTEIPYRRFLNRIRQPDLLTFT